MIKEIGKLTLGSKHTALKMWEVNVAKGERVLREHRHINFEIALALSGEGLYHTVKGKRKIKSGDIFVFASNEPHCITKIENPNLLLLNLHFTNKIVENLPLLDRDYPYIFFNHAKDFDCKIPSEKASKITEKLLKIREELQSKNLGCECEVASLINEIFILLIRNHGFYSESDELSSVIIKKLEKGIDYINGHFTEDITLELIAEKSNISPNYFSSLFKECLNMKLWDYITAKRIEKAKRLLSRKDSQFSILEIATQCGFNNTANFNRSFKLHTGVTPSIYRKNRYENII